MIQNPFRKDPGQGIFNKIWQLVDDILNVILFMLIGLELLVIQFKSHYILIGILSILLVIATRFVPVWLPAPDCQINRKNQHAYHPGPYLERAEGMDFRGPRAFPETSNRPGPIGLSQLPDCLLINHCPWTYHPEGGQKNILTSLS